ncbi:hypothetical protein SO802_012407 [Lithocarpus litseifolius]|uniref:Sulfite exporter TauE/SafE family protein n=1 Tax=Lithocarpus litseifolius TaxID=425828 RepID=A0AAW2D6L2_9ROSI
MKKTTKTEKYWDWELANETNPIWELEFSWRLVLATVIGFLGSACGTVGGVGGGGIFLPMLTLIVSFDTNSAAALSKFEFVFICEMVASMIMGASASSVWYNLRLSCPPHMWRLMRICICVNLESFFHGASVNVLNLEGLAKRLGAWSQDACPGLDWVCSPVRVLRPAF